MKLNNAIVPNNIPTTILKEFKSKLSQPLSDMINVSFNKGIFPNFLKIANVIPIHKKGEKLDPNNYRPISLLYNISRLYEKAMHIQLTNFLRKNKVLFSYQFGFWNNIQCSFRPHRNDTKCSCQWRLCLWYLHRKLLTLSTMISFFPN